LKDEKFLGITLNAADGKHIPIPSNGLLLNGIINLQWKDA